jgi:hypothetical protein
MDEIATHPQAREDLDALFAEMDREDPSEATRWAVYGYIYGLRHADRLSRLDFNGYLDRLGIGGNDAEGAAVAL